jgi:malonyl-CoA/methylmalonyl-CoA synthetase
LVVIAKSSDTFDEQRIREFGRERLASFKLPKRVVAVDDLPRNAMGKVQKNLLRDQYVTLMSEA